MNEILFFIHILLVFAFGLTALKMGKEALTAWVALQAVLANLFVLKQISFLGFNITCSDVFAIGSILGLNLLREYYGKKSAARALWICFFGMLFFVAMSQMHLFYQPSSYDSTHASYSHILSSSPRLLGASIAVFFIVQQVDLRLFAFFQERSARFPLVVRNALSLSISQLLDTILFSILGLWGLLSSLFDIITISFLVKLLIIAGSSPIVAFSKRLIPTPRDNL